MALAVLPPSDGPVRDVRSAFATVNVRAEGPCAVLALRGEFDLAARPVLSDALLKVIASRDVNVVIDLAQVRFIDSAIVRSLAASQQLLDRQGRTLTFRSPSRLAAVILDLFGLTDLIDGDRHSPHVNVVHGVAAVQVEGSQVCTSESERSS